MQGAWLYYLHDKDSAKPLMCLDYGLMDLLFCINV